MDELIRRYEVSNQAEGKSPRTIQWYSENLRALSAFMKLQKNNDCLSYFTVDTLREYILYLQKRPRLGGYGNVFSDCRKVSPRTVQCHVRTAKAFSSWVAAEGYTKENRLRNLKLPRAPAKIIEPLTPGEIKAVLGCTNTHTTTGFRDHVIVATALDTGLRASELASIAFDQMNLDSGCIKVMGKGSKERIVPIGKVVRSLLWGYVTGARIRLSREECNSLFLSDNGKPLTVNALKLVFSKLAKRSGVRRLHAHLCRHTFAVNYLLNGGDIFSLQQILGHSSLEMVRHYLRFTDSQITAQHHKFSPMDRMEGEGRTGRKLPNTGVYQDWEGRLVGSPSAKQPAGQGPPWEHKAKAEGRYS